MQKRGSEVPDYSPADAQYRSDRLTELNIASTNREITHMELNGLSYSQYCLLNKQMDIAYNPPKQTASESRIVSGLIHEKDQTLVSVIMDMNFQPKVKALDPNDRYLNDAANIFTAKIKKALLQDNFRDKMENIARLLVSQGNVFVTNKKYDKWTIRKIKTSKKEEKNKVTWKTVYEKQCEYSTTEILPNTSVYPVNIIENDIKKQPRMYTVMHYPTSLIAQIFKNNPRWSWVPKHVTITVAGTEAGIWGDYYLMQPTEGFVEVITMESEIFNEFNVWINGVQMYPVQLENNMITGYPLTEVSASGGLTMSKGDFERIPFFFFSKSNPSKNQVKEEEINEVMRLMVLFLRQKAAPPVGNNTNRVLPANLWDPNMIIPDIRKDDISILTPNNGIGQAEFSFYKMLQESLAETSVSPSVEGNNNAPITATQYIDQKKENLKKIGLSLDRTIELLRQIYWNILFNEISYIDQKTKEYKSDGSFKEAYQSFSVEDSIDGRKGNVIVNLTDDTEEIDPYAVAKQEAESKTATRIYHAKPKSLQNIIKTMRDKLYMDVVAQPEGEQIALLAQLFNIMTQYSNLKGGDTRKINFDYLETIIADNSGFDADRVWLDEPIESPMSGVPTDPRLALNQNAAAGKQVPAVAG